MIFSLWKAKCEGEQRVFAGLRVGWRRGNRCTPDKQSNMHPSVIRCANVNQWTNKFSTCPNRHGTFINATLDFTVLVWMDLVNCYFLALHRPDLSRSLGAISAAYFNAQLESRQPPLIRLQYPMLAFGSFVGSLFSDVINKSSYHFTSKLLFHSVIATGGFRLYSLEIHSNHNTSLQCSLLLSRFNTAPVRYSSSSHPA